MGHGAMGHGAMGPGSAARHHGDRTPPTWRARSAPASSVPSTRSTSTWRASTGSPPLNAVVARDDEAARAQARRLDEAFARSGPVGVLHGVPFTVKDWLDADGLPCVGEGDDPHRRPRAMPPRWRGCGRRAACWWPSPTSVSTTPSTVRASTLSIRRVRRAARRAARRCSWRAAPPPSGSAATAEARSDFLQPGVVPSASSRRTGSSRRQVTTRGSASSTTVARSSARSPARRGTPGSCSASWPGPTGTIPGPCRWRSAIRGRWRSPGCGWPHSGHRPRSRRPWTCWSPAAPRRRRARHPPSSTRPRTSPGATGAAAR